MAPVTKPTKSKKDTRKTCTTCRRKFQPSHQSIKTCSEECKRVRHNKGKKNTAQKKRQPKPLQMSNAFIQLLLRHAKQAGTAQIVQGVTTEELLELREMHKLQLRANSSSSDAFGAFQFSHVYPVKGQRHTGKFVPVNLVVASAGLNRSFKNTHLGGGAYIHFTDKNSKWDIQGGMSDQAIVELMIECITRPVWDAFAKVAKLQPSVRQCHLDTLGTLLDPVNVEHTEYLKVMNNPKTSTQDLRSLVEAVTGKELFQVSTHCYVSAMMMLILETRRMSVYRPELALVLNVLEQVQQMSSHFIHDDFNITEFDEGLFFDILHGKQVTSSAMEVLNDFLVDNLSSIYDTYGVKPVFVPGIVESPEQVAIRQAVMETRSRVIEERRAVVQQAIDSQPSFWDMMEQQQAA